MQKASFLLFFLLITFLSRAQPDYREGFVILANGDTVRGYIDYHHYTPCRFRQSRTQKGFVEYSEDNLIGYGFSDGRFLLSKEYPDRKSGKKTKGFLEVLLLGDVSLYQIRGESFIETADTIVSLKPGKKKIVQTKEGGLRLSQRKIHYGILNYLLRDCPSVTSKLKKIKAHPEQILKVLEEYHKCRGLEYKTFVNTTPPIRVNFGVEAGVVSSKLAYYSHEISSFSPDHLTINTFSPAGKLFISWPRTRDRFSFVLGVQYLQGHYPVQVQFQHNGVIYHAEASFDARRLKMPFGFHYRFSKGAVSPVVGLGLLWARKLHSYLKYILEVESGDEVETFTGETSPLLDNTMGVWIAGGVRVRINKKITGFAEVSIEGSYSTEDLIPRDVLRGTLLDTTLKLGIMF